LDFDIILYKDTNCSEWNQYISKIGESTYLNDWRFISYLEHFHDVIDNFSFIALTPDKFPLCVCTLGLTFFSELKTYEMSFSGSPCSIPAFSELKPSMRRKLSDQIYKIIFDYAVQKKVKLIRFEKNPLNISSCRFNSVLCEYMFEPLRYNLTCGVSNTLIINLNEKQDILEKNLSKYHHKHIRRSKKKGLSVKIYNDKNNKESLKEKVDEFRYAHIKAAGRETRSIDTWTIMYEAAKNGKATLFLTYLENIPISYLFCGEYDKMAFGWSQVNVEQYQKQYSPRHLLEWESILYYKRNGFSFYELGIRFFGPNLLYTPSVKEINISVFKERYGGILYPKTNWLAFMDNDYLTSQHEKLLSNIGIINHPS